MVEALRIDTGGGRTVLTLARGSKANALTRGMLTALADAVEGAAAAEDRVLVLTADGTTFSAGMDLAEASNGLALDPAWERLSAAVAAFPGLSVAALNGPVAGGALGMVLACDVRIAVPSVRIFYPVMRLGFLPQPSDPGRLARLVGPARARMILLGGVQVNAEQALDWGLVDRVVPSDGLAEAVRTLTADAMAAAPAHVAAIKRMTR